MILFDRTDLAVVSAGQDRSDDRWQREYIQHPAERNPERSVVRNSRATGINTWLSGCRSPVLTNLFVLEVLDEGVDVESVDESRWSELFDVSS